MTGHLTGVVAGHRPVLLVGPVMLLIQHDQSELRQRQKNRRTGSHRHQWRPVRRLQAAAPRPHPLGFPHAAVVLQNAGTEAGPAAIEQLGNEADLRSQQQGTAARSPFPAHRLQVDLSLARPGHAPEQQG